MNKYQHFIDGQWMDSESGKTFSTPNPATGQPLAEIAEGDKADVDKAVAAARRAFEGKWSKMSARDRGRLLYKLSQLIEQYSAELAEIETADNGKPIKESLYVDLPQVVDRKSTRLNSSHGYISYAVFCLKKKTKTKT